MLVWFMLRDEADHGGAGSGGFQTGLVWNDDRLKPAFAVFQRLARPPAGVPVSGSVPVGPTG